MSKHKGQKRVIRNNTAPGIKPPKQYEGRSWMEDPKATSPLETTQVNQDGTPTKVTYHKQQPTPKKPVESLMCVAYISTKTFPDYQRMQIEAYDWMPEMVHYVMNNVKQPVWKNKFDAKLVETFNIIKPTKYYIHHASDVVLMPHDLGRMKKLLDNDPKCCAVGIYPIGNQMSHTRLFQDFVIPTRIVIWDAKVFGKYLKPGLKAAKKAFKGVPLDSMYFIGAEAIKDGWHTMIDAKSRVFKVDPNEYKTMWVNPAHFSE